MKLKLQGGWDGREDSRHQTASILDADRRQKARAANDGGEGAASSAEASGESGDMFSAAGIAAE